MYKYKILRHGHSAILQLLKKLLTRTLLPLPLRPIPPKNIFLFLIQHFNIQLLFRRRHLNTFQNNAANMKDASNHTIPSNASPISRLNMPTAPPNNTSNSRIMPVFLYRT